MVEGMTESSHPSTLVEPFAPPGAPWRPVSPKLATVKRISATVTALTRADLLVLDGGDLRRLMDRDPRISDRIQEVVRERVAQGAFTLEAGLVIAGFLGAWGCLA